MEVEEEEEERRLLIRNAWSGPPSWAPSWSRLWGLLDRIGGLLCRPGAVWGCLGGLLCRLGAFLGRLGALLHPLPLPSRFRRFWGTFSIGLPGSIPGIAPTSLYKKLTFTGLNARLSEGARGGLTRPLEGPRGGGGGGGRDDDDDDDDDDDASPEEPS